jgi:hypothetical protein
VSPSFRLLCSACHEWLWYCLVHCPNPCASNERIGYDRLLGDRASLVCWARGSRTARRLG